MVRGWLAVLAIVGCKPPEVIEPTLPPAPPPVLELGALPAMPAFTLTQRTPLDEVAEVAARSASTDHVVSARALHAAMGDKLGSALWPYVLTGWGSDGEIGVQLQDGLRELRDSVDIAEIGMATADGPAGRVGVIVALPLPRLPIEVGRGTETSRISMPWIWSEEAAAFAVTATTARRIDPAMLARTADRLELAVDCTRPAAIETAPVRRSSRRWSMPARLRSIRR